MLTRQKLVTYGISTLAAGTIVVVASLATRSNEPTPPTTVTPDPVAVQDGHQIDVVFAVDTTGSMGPLIESAKRTVWGIAGHIREVDAQADVRIGLVAYRDIGDEYVTRAYPLSGDLDQMFVNLSSFRANGGGDVPEHVSAALNDAMKMQWRPGAKKIVFVVGDAEPHDQGDLPPFDVLTRQAADRGITVNAIRAGTRSQTQLSFEKIALLGNGEFSSIQQDGGVQQVATPYDAKLAELSKKIDSTAVIVGGQAARDGYAAKMEASAAAPATTMADRATYYSGKGGGGPRDKADIVGTGAAVDSIEPSALPAELRTMSKEQLKTELARRATERQQAQAELDTLAKQRAEYLNKNKPSGGEGGFDSKVKSSVEKAMKKK